MKAMLIGLALAMQIPPPPGGIAWEQVARFEGHDVMLDRASIRREGDLVRFNMRMIDPPDANGRRASLVTRDAIDCAARTGAMEAAALYLDDDTLVESRIFTREERPMEPLVPGSGGMQAYDLVCR